MSQDPLSQTSYYIKSSYQGSDLMTGTAFFIKRNDRIYLITNWHNLTARNPSDGSYLLKHPVSPDAITIKIFENSKVLNLVDLQINILDASGNPIWLEHPKYGKSVDVVALEVTIPANMQVLFIEDCIEPLNEKTQARIKDDVFVIGFPFGIIAGNIFPIWKRASVASEPIVNIDNLPKMYIDTASRPGMSGSPVVYKEKRPMGLTDGNPNEAGTKMSFNFMQLVGIYSGRIGADDELKAQLGIVWKYEVIDEIIH